MRRRISVVRELEGSCLRISGSRTGDLIVSGNSYERYSQHVIWSLSVRSRSARALSMHEIPGKQQLRILPHSPSVWHWLASRVETRLQLELKSFGTPTAYRYWPLKDSHTQYIVDAYTSQCTFFLLLNRHHGSLCSKGECMDAVFSSDSLIGYCSNRVRSVVLASQLFQFTGVLFDINWWIVV